MCDVSLCFVIFPYGVLGQVLYLMVSILNLCILHYFHGLADSRWLFLDSLEALLCAIEQATFTLTLVQPMKHLYMAEYQSAGTENIHTIEQNKQEPTLVDILKGRILIDVKH